MKIRIEKPFIEKSVSPLAFQPNELLTVPDSVGKRLIKSGHAINLDDLRITPVKETR